MSKVTYTLISGDNVNYITLRRSQARRMLRAAEQRAVDAGCKPNLHAMAHTRGERAVALNDGWVILASAVRS